MCTASSDGKIRVFDLAAVPRAGEESVVQIEPEAEYDTKGTRLTCIALADGDDEGEGVMATMGKRKRGEEEREDGDGEGEGEEEEEEEWGGLEEVVESS